MNIDRTTRRMLVLHAGALGDCILTLHWIEAVRRAWGAMNVTLAARSPIAHWAARHGLVTEALTLDSIGAHRLYFPLIELPDDLIRFVGGFDTVVSFLDGPEAPVSRGLTAIAGDRLIAIDPRPTDATKREGVHIVEQWLGGVGLAETKQHGSPGLRLVLTSGRRRVARETLLERLTPRGPMSSPIALCHPGSGGLDKCCPIEALEAVMEGLAERELATGWMMGPDEVDRFGSALRSRLERLAPVVFEENIADAAELLLGADLYVGNDAGMTHAAALCGARTIALFGPTDPRVWRPLGRECETVSFPDPSLCVEAWVRETVELAVGALLRRPATE